MTKSNKKQNKRNNTKDPDSLFSFVSFLCFVLAVDFDLFSSSPDSHGCGVLTSNIFEFDLLFAVYFVWTDWARHLVPCWGIVGV